MDVASCGLAFWWALSKHRDFTSKTPQGFVPSSSETLPCLPQPSLLKADFLSADLVAQQSKKERNSTNKIFVPLTGNLVWVQPKDFVGEEISGYCHIRDSNKDSCCLQAVTLMGRIPSGPTSLNVPLQALSSSDSSSGWGRLCS